MTDTTAPRTVADHPPAFDARVVGIYIDHLDEGRTSRKEALEALARLRDRAEAIEPLLALVRELAETVHQTGNLRDHADPNDLTGWNVHGIETCEDSLCREALAALPESVRVAARKPE